ncbi:spermatogenesis-associated protein 31A3-like, partial [Psammomys obesus]|uniref:spermatogenesis-associated protein 31A3-like n=1 Tax=Psammomys obesus TaxID=48139 RepID=UPI002452EB23
MQAFFIKPDAQEMLELQIRKRVKLNIWKGKGKERPDLELSCLSMLHPYGGQQPTVTPHPFWSRHRKSQQLSGQQQLLYQNSIGNDLQQKHSQLFWGLPSLHSESLGATVSRAGSPLDSSAILFNGLSPYIRVHANVPEQVRSLKPLLQPSVQSQPLTPNLSWSRSPPVAGIQTQASGPSSIPKLPCNSPPTRNCGASCPAPSRSQSVPPAVQHLDCHLLKKHQESRGTLPTRVKKSREAFNQLTPNSWSPEGPGSVPHLPGEFINPEFREQLEQHLKKRFTQHQGQWPHEIQPSLPLIKSQHKLQGMGLAEDDHRTSCPPALADESSQHLQGVSSQGPEMCKTWRDPCKDLTDCQGRSQKDLHRIPEGSLGQVQDTISETEMESCHVKHPRSDSQSPQPVRPGKNQLEGILKNHLGSSWRQAKESKVPVGTCHGIPINRALVPPENSETHTGTEQNPSLNGQATVKNTCDGLSFLDPGTQVVLETHLTRRLVRHRWSLPLRGLKTIHVFNMTKAVALPFPQARPRLLTCWDSTEDSIDQMGIVLGESLQKDPEEEVTTKTDFSRQASPTVQPEFLTGTTPADNYGSSEAPSTVQDSEAFLSTQHSLVGRGWHSDMVRGPRTCNLEKSPNLVQAGCESQESQGAALRPLYQGVSVPESSVASQSPSTRGSTDLEEADDEEFCDWALNMANCQPHSESLRDLESLQTTESQSSFRTLFQDPEDSGLSTPPHSATAVVLQDCATGTFSHVCVPEVLLAADLLASTSSQSSFRTTRKPCSWDKHPFLSPEGNAANILKPQKPWISHIFGPTHVKEDYRGAAPTCTVNTQYRKFGDRIKKMIKMLTPENKVREGSLQDVRALSTTPQSRGPVKSRVAEAQGLLTTVAWIPEENLGGGHAGTPSKKSLPKQPPQAPPGRHVCYRMSFNAETDRAQGNPSCVHHGNWRVYNQPPTAQGSLTCVHHGNGSVHNQPFTAQGNPSCVHHASRR